MTFLLFPEDVLFSDPSSSPTAVKKEKNYTSFPEEPTLEQPEGALLPDALFEGALFLASMARRFTSWLKLAHELDSFLSFQEFIHKHKTDKSSLMNELLDSSSLTTSQLLFKLSLFFTMKGRPLLSQKSLFYLVQKRDVLLGEERAVLPQSFEGTAQEKERIEAFLRLYHERKEKKKQQEKAYKPLQVREGEGEEFDTCLMTYGAIDRMDPAFLPLKEAVLLARKETRFLRDSKETIHLLLKEKVVLEETLKEERKEHILQVIETFSMNYSQALSSLFEKGLLTKEPKQMASLFHSLIDLDHMQDPLLLQTYLFQLSTLLSLLKRLQENLSYQDIERIFLPSSKPVDVARIRFLFDCLMNKEPFFAGSTFFILFIQSFFPLSLYEQELFHLLKGAPALLALSMGWWGHQTNPFLENFSISPRGIVQVALKAVLLSSSLSAKLYPFSTPQKPLSFLLKMGALIHAMIEDKKEAERITVAAWVTTLSFLFLVERYPLQEKIDRATRWSLPPLQPIQFFDSLLSSKVEAVCSTTTLQEALFSPSTTNSTFTTIKEAFHLLRVEGKCSFLESLLKKMEKNRHIQEGKEEKHDWEEKQNLIEEIDRLIALLFPEVEKLSSIQLIEAIQLYKGT